MMSVVFDSIESIMIEVIVDQMAQSSHNKLIKTTILNQYQIQQNQSLISSSAIIRQSPLISFMFKRIKSLPHIQKVKKALFTPNSNHQFILPQSKRHAKSILIVDDSRPTISSSKDKGRLKSRSSMELFRGAHSVGKKETFLRQKVEPKQETASAMMMRAEQIRKNKTKLQRAQQEIDKKLRINEKINSAQLFLDRSRSSRIKAQSSSQLLRIDDSKNKNGQSTLTLQMGMSQELKPFKKPDVKNFYQSEEHFMEKKPTPRWEYPLQGLSAFRHQSNIQNQSGRKSESASLEIISNHFESLNLTLKESIRQQMSKLTQQRENKLKKQMDQKQQQYLSKLNSIYKQIQSHLQSEKEVVRNMVHLAEQNQRSMIKQVQQNQHQRLFNMEASFGKNQVPVPTTNITEAKPIERQSSFKKNPSQKGIKTSQKQLAVQKAQGVKLKTEEPPKMVKQFKSQSIFQNEEDDGYFDDLQQIKLEPVSRNIIESSNQINIPKNIDRSFNVGTKLNESFGSEQPAKNKGNAVDSMSLKPSDSKSVKAETKSVQMRDEKEQRKLFELQKKKKELRAQLKQEHWENPYLTELGKVFIQCSKNMKKSKIEWRTPAMLLYRYCFDSYDSYTECYQQAFELGVIKKEEMENFKKEINQIRQTMLNKILPAILKKVKLNSKYQALIQSNQNQMEDMRPIIDREVNQFINTLSKSDELKDPIVAKCGLRMVNAMFIIRKLGVDSKLQVLQNIDDLPSNKCQSTYREWVVRLQRLWKDQNRQ